MIKLFPYPHIVPPERKWCLEIDFSANGVPICTQFFPTADAALEFAIEWMNTAVVEDSNGG